MDVDRDRSRVHHRLRRQLVVSFLWAGDSRTAGVTLAALSAEGVICGVIGAVTRSRLAALLAGAFGHSLTVLILGSGYGTPWLVILWVLLEVPYLVGFAVAALFAAAVLSEPPEGP